jgi:hypothetical protein
MTIAAFSADSKVAGLAGAVRSGAISFEEKPW